MSARYGVTAASAVTSTMLVGCNDGGESTYAGRPHRIHSILTNSLNHNAYEGFSAVWGEPLVNVDTSDR